jgi:hypothetical protein
MRAGPKENVKAQMSGFLCFKWANNTLYIYIYIYIMCHLSVQSFAIKGGVKVLKLQKYILQLVLP